MTDRQDIEARMAALEDQVRRLSDELELYRLTASYGPAVDSGSAEETAALWVEDGIYDVDVRMMTGAGEIAGLVHGEPHQRILAQGCCHVISMPRISVDGDTAVGTCASRLYVRDGDGFRMWRVAANRWEFVRTQVGWRISRRTNRLVDGNDEARELFGQTFADGRGPQEA